MCCPRSFSKPSKVRVLHCMTRFRQRLVAKREVSSPGSGAANRREFCGVSLCLKGRKLHQTEHKRPDDFHLLDPQVVENPYPFYRALLAHAPVYCVPGTQVYLVSAWSLIHQVLRNQTDYSANLTGILMRGEDGQPQLFDLSQFDGTVDSLANADEPFHAVHRRLVLPQLNARRVAALEDEVRSWARSGVARLLERGGHNLSDLVDAIPVKVMARLAGLPVADVDQLLQWAFSGGDLLAGTADLARMAELGASTSALAAYLREHFAAALKTPQAEPDSVLQELVRGVAAGQIAEAEAIGILIVLVGAAGESTSSLVGSAIRLLAQDVELQQQLREQPALIDAFVEEVVRLEAPFKGHYRAVLNDTRLGGVGVPAGSHVFLLWAAANRDPAVFAQPDELQLARPNIKEHLGFGHGIHFCIGARVARLEARVILEELLAGTASFTLDSARPPRHVQSIFVRRLAAIALAMKAPDPLVAHD